MRQLTGLDTLFLNLETANTPLHVASAAIVDPASASGEWGYERVREVVESRLHLLPPFRWRLVEVPLGLDHPYWIDDPDFDLEFHLRRLAVPPPGDEATFAEIVARIHARPLDRSRPLWEMYVIEGLHTGAVAVMTKMHHAAIDGVSGADLMGVLLDTEPDPEPPPPPETPLRGEREPSTPMMLLRSGRGLVRQPLRMARAAAKSVSAAPVVGRFAQAALPEPLRSRVGEGLIGKPQLQAPPSPFNAPVSPHRRWAFGTLDLATIKDVKNHAGCTVNDVVMAVCGGAVRAFLVDRGGLPDDPMQAMVPISVRAEDESGAMGNRVNALIAALPTHLGDPRERLEFAASSMDVAKSGNAVPADLMTDVTQFMAPALTARAARTLTRLRWAERFRTPFNLVVSNVPGPRIPLYLAGARLQHWYPISAIGDGIGLNITVISYLDQVDVGIVGDRDLVPDLDELMVLMQAELKVLRDVVA